MPRRPTGQVIAKVDREGVVAYALRYRVAGRRRYFTLGSEKQGWTEQRARDELDRVMASIADGTWAEPGVSPLRALAQRLIAEASDEDLAQHDGLAAQLLDEASDEDLQGELFALCRRLIGDVMRRDRQDAIEGALSTSDTPLDLEVIVAPAGDTKRLGDCTTIDVETLAYEYEKRARDLLAYAGRWRGLVDAMREAEAETVRDLGAEDAANAMRRGRQYKVLRNDELPRVAA